mgnify:CR=1 FL=1
MAIRTLTSLSLLSIALVASPASADRTIFLDFDGHRGWFANYRSPNQTDWLYLDVPPFCGSAADRADIAERVREDFAPFDVEITTEEPPDLEEGADVGFRVIIGGDYTDWNYSRAVYGLSSHPLVENAVLVAAFAPGSGPACADVRSNKDIAQTSSHELAHSIAWLSGQWLSHYTATHHPVGAPAHVGFPILGSFSDRRDIWYADEQVERGYDRRTGEIIIGPQDDIDTLADGLGLRADDHGDTPQFGSLLQRAPDYGGDRVLKGEGIVEINEASDPSACPEGEILDSPVLRAGLLCLGPHPRPVPLIGDHRDFFLFEADWGPGGSQRLDIRVDTINRKLSKPLNDPTANLDAELEIYHRAAGPLSWWSGWRKVTSYAVGHGQTDLWARATLVIGARDNPPGHYAVGVRSAGGYGDLGQYQVTVRAPAIRELEWEGWWTLAYASLLDELSALDEGAGLKTLLQRLAEQQLIDPAVLERPEVLDVLPEVLEEHRPSEIFAHLFAGAVWEQLPADERKAARFDFDHQVRRILFGGAAVPR